MTLSHAVFAGFALVAAAVLFSGEFSAQAKKAPGDATSAAYALGLPNVTGETSHLVWRVNRQTGQVSVCVLAQNMTNDPPVCSPWSAS
ncbi:MAG: hypothetical protein MI755_06850 [Sphingomonadales bacterium]|nr:hypothetical protein [Sphingomonadales bacterium]